MTALLLAAALAAQAPEIRWQPEALEVLASMGTAAAHVNDYTMMLVKRELRGTELDPEETLLVKWQRPQRIYLRELEGPREGQEVLYATGWNKNRIKVHRGSFPAINLNLDPYGTLAMAHAHHAVPEVSLVRFVDLVLDNAHRAQAKNVGTGAVVAHETLWGRPATKLELTTPPTGTSPTLKKGETLWDVARATGQDMYVILHANRARQWRQADHPNPGDAVIVPEFYAGRLVLWVDDALHLPLQADLYDQEGQLYEHYEHRDLAVNVGLTPADFDPKNPAYHF
ncbi:MAG TPA: DUF1571 domain-containing protein [Candidatus Polarisedimenticolaceae bacterium]|nr:DUF1571 domain-containing protein [Candidatus Polarisedimenticolaceae bacterium]